MGPQKIIFWTPKRYFLGLGTPGKKVGPWKTWAVRKSKVSLRNGGGVLGNPNVTGGGIYSQEVGFSVMDIPPLTRRIF